MSNVEEQFVKDADAKLTNEQTYDSALATMVSKLDEFVPPLVNEVFGEKFTQNASVTLRNNKHIIQRTDDSLDRRDSDAFVELSEMLEEAVSKTYIFECEAWYDKTIVLRIAEYGSSVAIENAEITEDDVVLTFPYSAVIFLHSNRKIPDKMKITYRGPNGAEMSYYVPALQIKNYTVEDIFRKKLLILLPFYLFKFDKEFGKMENDEKKMEELERVLIDINTKLEQLEQDEEITAYQKLTTQSLLLRVTDRLTASFVKVRKEVNRIMSGAIARTQADDILEQGQEQGWEETAKLMNYLWRNGRGADAEKAEKDKNYLKDLMEQFLNGKLATT